MTVLVTAASKHGATLEIAETIARVLEERGIEAEFIELDQVGDLGGYDAHVVGSAIYLGNWLEEARRFIAVRGAHASEGDHRDWGEIERWAEEIAMQLTAEGTSKQS